MNKMLKPYFHILAIIILIFMSQDAFAIDLPSQVSQGLKVTQQWLNKLDSKSIETIQAELGEPKKRNTWNLQGKDEPLWEYDIEESKYSLLLYFSNGAVIKGSLQLLTD